MSRMWNSRLWGKITVLIAVCGWGLSAQAKYDGGSGTEGDPFRVSEVADCQELMATPEDWASHFVLTADIDLNGVSITPIAPDTSTSYGFQGTQFTGVFDGNDHIISNADVNMPGSDFVGLFGGLGTNGQIKNLGVEDVSIVGRYYVGGLVGRNYDGTISNCYSTGSVASTASDFSNVGGLVGYNDGAITNCYSTGSVSGDDFVGGLVGFNEGTISNCYSIGSVNGAGYDCGGLVGCNWFGIISNCYSTGSVNGDEDVGGLVGRDRGSISNSYSAGSVSGTGDSVGGLVGYSYFGSISNCCSTGSVSGTASYVGGLVGQNVGTISNSYSTGTVSATGSYVGGLVGQNGMHESGCAPEFGCWDDYYSGWTYNCYSTGKVSGGYGVGGLVGVHVYGEVGDSYWDSETSEQSSSASGTPKTTGEMKTQSTFTSAAWDFVGETVNGPNDVWRMCVDGVQYPLLSWQFIPDFTCPDGVDILDLAFFVDRWLADCDETNNFCNCTDINHDAQVDFGDFAFFSRHWLEGVIPQDMVLIPGGTFQMGDNLGGGYSERPVHTVRLDSFYMGKYEITNQQYCAFLNWADDNGWITVTSGVVYKAGSGTSYPYCDTSTLSSYSQIAYGGGLFSVRTKGGRSMVNDPMVKVSWYGAAAYCNWRSLQEGKELCYYPATLAPDPSKHGYRLATEAEWEHAARGGLAGRRFPWGDTISHSQANYYSSGDYAYDVSPTRSYHPAWDDILPYTSPVGSFPVTGYGLYDMAGNVLEWCNDWYQWNYYTGRPNPDVNPTGPATGTTRVVRGGGWGYNAPRDCYCRVASRSYLRAPPDRSYSIGFRLVLDF